MEVASRLETNERTTVKMDVSLDGSGNAIMGTDLGFELTDLDDGSLGPSLQGCSQQR